jgi:hypothetical protein
VTPLTQEYTDDGIPRFPVFIGERADVDRPKDAIIKKPTA